MAIACFFGRWREERWRNEEIKAALRAYLRDFTPRGDGDRRALENRRRFIATLAELPLGELAPEWAAVEGETVVEAPAPVEEERAPLKVVRGAGR